jgi:hypothetical protein
VQLIHLFAACCLMATALGHPVRALAERTAGAVRSADRTPKWVYPQTLLHGCCPIYCPKPLPHLPCWCYGCGCDDYCGKQRPNVPCYRGGCCDYYCPKPYPCLCRPLAADFYTCAEESTNCTGWNSPNGHSTTLAPKGPSQVTPMTPNDLPLPAPLPAPDGSQ